MTKTPKLLRNGRQRAYVVLCDGDFFMAFAKRHTAEHWRRDLAVESKRKWTIIRGALVFAAARHRADAEGK